MNGMKQGVRFYEDCRPPVMQTDAALILEDVLNQYSGIIDTLTGKI